MKIAFFGTPELTLPVLNALQAHDLTPSLVITNPDQPVGRQQIITPPPVKIWATSQQIPVWQPAGRAELLTSDSPLQQTDWDLFIVFAYGQILPATILDLPRHQTINLHPSLLPQLRGPSPIRSAIRNDINPTGVSVMLLDTQMDHGPILAQASVTIPTRDWPLPGPDLETLLISRGAALLVDTIPRWVAGEITPQEQNHQQATYCHFITKADAQLYLDPFSLPTGPAAYQALLQIRAYAGWPEAFFVYQNQRVKIRSASIKDNQLLIERVVPAGRNEMEFRAFLQMVGSN